MYFFQKFFICKFVGLAIICVLEKEWELITEGDWSFRVIFLEYSCALFAQLAKVEPWNCLTQIILCFININLFHV